MEGNRQMKRWLGMPLLLLVLVGWALKVNAQQSIMGTLIDAETEEPIGYNPEVAPHIEYGDIFDLNGHKLNVPNYVEVSQYRELFRQEINPNYQLPEDPMFIDRDTTLNANFIQLEQVQDLKSFWINTPLKN